MGLFRDRAGELVRTAKRIAELRGASSEALLLAQATAGLIEAGYDSWNGGVDHYILTLEVPVAVYARIEDEREDLEASIYRRVSDLIRAEAGSTISQVVISPQMESTEASNAETGSTGGSGEDQTPAFWKPGYFRLFLSHPAVVKKPAHAIKEALAKHQVAAFVAHDDIEPTREWQAEIESALRTMDGLAAILTADFVGSKWCDQEVGFALGRGRLVLPLRAGADPHGFLGKHQGLDIRGSNAATVAAAIASVLIKHDLSASRMADATIERLAGANSYERARDAMSLLEQVPRLNRGQVSKLAQLPEANDQVRDAFGVPARIDALIRRAGVPDTA